MEILAKHYRTGEAICVQVDQKQISQLSNTNLATEQWVAPALIDIQINGFGGLNFNGPDASPNTVEEIVRHQWSLGIGSLCPTVTTNSQQNMLHALSSIAAACHYPETSNSIPGIHIEGPYISHEDGPRGAHTLEHVRRPSWAEFQEWQDAAEGRIRLVTLAPEVEGGIPFIERLVDEGIVVAIGHSSAEIEDIEHAVRAGAKLSTHLGNGAHALMRRHPNYIWEQLARDELSASLIVDGHHLPPSVVKCMTRCKGLARTILVSDAVTFAGMPPGRYGKGKSLVDVSKEGRISLADTPYLAGAGLDLASCVANFARFTGHSLADAIDAASLQPASLLDMDGLQAPLKVGRRADLVLFDRDDDGMRVIETIVAGRSVFQA